MTGQMADVGYEPIISSSIGCNVAQQAAAIKAFYGTLSPHVDENERNKLGVNLYLSEVVLQDTTCRGHELVAVVATDE